MRPCNFNTGYLTINSHSDIKKDERRKWGIEMSTVYVLTNEAMPGLVKVGKTSGPLEKRMRELYKTGVPIPFSCFYAVDVDDADFVERKIHEAFDDVRLNESREFFTIAPEKVKAALEITGGKEVTPSEEIIETETDLVAIEKQRNRNRFNFSKIGIEAGTILEFKKKPSETCKVLDDDQVLFRDETTSLSKSALTLIQELGYNWDKIAGPQFWSYKGKTLYELSNERQ